METLLGVAVLVVVVWLYARARRGGSGAARARTGPESFRSEIESAVSRDYAAAVQRGELRKVAGKAGTEHVPPAPSGRAVEAWSPRTQQFEVAGEWYRAESLRALFDRHAKVSDAGAEIRLEAVLVPDPSNPFDNRAVAVVRPAPPTGPGPVTTSGQVAARHKGQSFRGSRSRLPTHSPAPSGCVGDPHSHTAACAQICR
jgi:hypothetical protein